MDAWIAGRQIYAVRKVIQMHKGTSKNWHMARDRRLWRYG